MRQHLLFLALLLLLCFSSVAKADCAPPPPVADETKKVDTEGAIGRFLQLVGLNVRVDVATEKKTIFSEYPNADQMVVALTAIYNLCSTLRDSSQLTDEQKINLLVSFQTDLLARAAGPRPVGSTAGSTRDVTPPAPQDQLSGEKKSQWDIANVQLVAMQDGVASHVEPRKASWADIYLNPIPIFITNNNKYFVIVGSVPSEAQGMKKLSELKSKYPTYDFELYGPYGSNTSYGIMIATWVSKTRATDALEAAKEIEPTSFIWACRELGDQC